MSVNVLRKWKRPNSRAGPSGCAIQLAVQVWVSKSGLAVWEFETAAGKAAANKMTKSTQFERRGCMAIFFTSEIMNPSLDMAGRMDAMYLSRVAPGFKARAHEQENHTRAGGFLPGRLSVCREACAAAWRPCTAEATACSVTQLVQSELDPLASRGAPSITAATKF